MIGRISSPSFKGMNGYGAINLFDKLVQRADNDNCKYCKEDDIKNITVNLTPEEIVDAY